MAYKIYTLCRTPRGISTKSRTGVYQSFKGPSRNLDLNQENPLRNEQKKVAEQGVPRLIFQTSKVRKGKGCATTSADDEEQIISPQHEEIVNFINEGWIEVNNMCNETKKAKMKANSKKPKKVKKSGKAVVAVYCNETQNVVLDDFKPFDLDNWCSRRLFNEITKDL